MNAVNYRVRAQRSNQSNRNNIITRTIIDLKIVGRNKDY